MHDLSVYTSSVLDGIELGIAALFDPTYKLDNSTSQVTVHSA